MEVEKPNVLIVDDEDEIREILTFFVKSVYPCNVSEAVNGEEAIAKLKDQQFHLVICDYNMPVKNGGEVYRYMIETHQPAKYVMCSSDTPQTFPVFNDATNLFGFIQKPNLMNGVKEIIEKMKAQGEYIAESSALEKDFFPIGINLLLTLRTVPVNVFIRISEGKHVKVYSAGDIFDETDFLKYSEKGILKLFTESNTADIIFSKIEEHVTDLLKNKSKTNKVEAVIEAQGVILSTLKEFGFHERLVPVVEVQIQETLNICNSDKTLGLLLSKMLKMQGSYIAKHSFMLATVTVALASKMGWNSDLTSQKLVISSLFHDVFLKDTVEDEVGLLKTRTYDEDFLSHPKKAAELLDKIPKVPPDTGRIILEQHEVGEENGFPRAIPIHETSPLGQLFTFSHYLVDALLIVSKNGPVTEDKVYAQLMGLSGQSSKYKKLMDHLKELELF